MNAAAIDIKERAEVLRRARVIIPFLTDVKSRGHAAYSDNLRILLVLLLPGLVWWNHLSMSTAQAVERHVFLRTAPR